MTNILSIIGIVILTITDLFVYSRILKEKINIKKKNLFLFIPMLCIIVMVNLFMNNNLRLMMTFLVRLIFYCLIFKATTREKILAVFTTQVLLIASEMIFVAIASLLFAVNVEDIANIYASTLIINILVSLLELLLCIIICHFHLEDKILKIGEHLKVKYIMIILLFVVVLADFFVYTTYYKLSSINFLIFNGATILVFLFITYKMLDEQNKHLLIKVEYDNLLDKSVEYEKLIDENRRDVHEFKNDLIVLKSLISKQNKKANEQINSMIKEYSKIDQDLEDDENLYRKTLIIPSGGLRGLIYHKLILIEELNINYSVRIGRNVNSKTLNKVNHEIVRQFVKIVGIYIDNAIAATKIINDKEINLEFYLEEGYFCLLISNKFSGSLDIDKIGTMGYSTKGNDHGYGLSLANEILKDNDYIKGETSIYRDIFTQIVKIKI